MRGVRGMRRGGRIEREMCVYVKRGRGNENERSQRKKRGNMTRLDAKGKNMKMYKNR
jgi:hypothetical protein